MPRCLSCARQEAAPAALLQRTTGPSPTGDRSRPRRRTQSMQFSPLDFPSPALALPKPQSCSSFGRSPEHPGFPAHPPRSFARQRMQDGIVDAAATEVEWEWGGIQRGPSILCTAVEFDAASFAGLRMRSYGSARTSWHSGVPSSHHNTKALTLQRMQDGIVDAAATTVEVPSSPSAAGTQSLATRMRRMPELQWSGYRHCPECHRITQVRILGTSRFHWGWGGGAQ